MSMQIMHISPVSPANKCLIVYYNSNDHGYETVPSEIQNYMYEVGSRKTNCCNYL
jgi:hypothetical protein